MVLDGKTDYRNSLSKGDSLICNFINAVICLYGGRFNRVLRMTLLLELRHQFKEMSKKLETDETNTVLSAFTSDMTDEELVGVLNAEENTKDGKRLQRSILRQSF